MLPDGSGLDFMRQLRESNNGGVPILLLTGLTTQEDILHGLRSGGDDYLTKPYDFPILLARVEALLRRSQRVPERVTLGRLSMDVAANAATLDGRNLLLTQKEFFSASVLCTEPGTVHQRRVSVREGVESAAGRRQRGAQNDDHPPADENCRQRLQIESARVRAIALKGIKRERLHTRRRLQLCNLRHFSFSIF